MNQVQFEEQVTQWLKDELGCSIGDAQALLEANEQLLQECIDQDLTALATAKMILKP